MLVQPNPAIRMIVATTASATVVAIMGGLSENFKKMTFACRVVVAHHNVELLAHYSERSSLHTIKRAPCILLKLKELLAYHSERSSLHTIKRAPCKVNK